MGSIGSLFTFYRHRRFDRHQEGAPLRGASHHTALRSMWTDPGGALHTPLACAAGTKLGLLPGSGTSHTALLFRGGGGRRRYTSPVAQFSSSTHHLVHHRRLSTRSCWPSTGGPNGAIFARRLPSLVNRFFYHGASVNHEVAACMEGDTEHRSSEGMSDNPILEPKHKIFLSHSGAQKEFVYHLCEALERRCHYPFFDRRDQCLPKGERFPELIIKATQQCQLLVVVVSKEFFMSKWPMMELTAFVQAQKAFQDLRKPKILPLFYGLSINDLKDEAKQKKWCKKWEALANADHEKRIVVEDWKYAFNELKKFSGLVYNQKSKEIIAYENQIVSHICKMVSPDLKWDDSHVAGKSSICEAICEKIRVTKASQKYKVKVVGIYGVGGIGKTTICKTLCNELSNKYDGKVCHLEFRSKGSKSEDLLQKVLIDLTSTSLEVLQQKCEGEYIGILRKSLSKQGTFLAVDNVWDDYESIKQAKMFLEADFHQGSLVIVTARSQRTLELLGIDGVACLEMPELEEAAAINLLLYHAARGKQFVNYDPLHKHDIQQCVQRCYFGKGDGEGGHYHPLALEALGRQLAYFGEDPSKWAKNLPKNFSCHPGENPVFDILRSSFDVLPETLQSLFVDLVIFKQKFRPWNSQCEVEFMEWLCLVYKQNKDQIKSQLHHLKRRGLLQDVDLASGRVSMHDLFVEFAELEAKGRYEESIDMEKRRWVYVDNGVGLSELERTPRFGYWHKLIRLGIGREFYDRENPIRIMEGIEWQYFSNVVVLKLHGLKWVGGALNVEGLKCLRSLELHSIVGLDRLEGLEGLKNLAFFKWDLLSTGGETHFVGRFPASLKVLTIHHGAFLGPDMFARCNNLFKLDLGDVRIDNLDLSNCSSLQTVKLWGVRKLRTLSFLTARWACRLQSLHVQGCNELVDIPGLDHLIGLERLVLKACKFKELFDLQSLTNLQVLALSGLDYFSGEAGLEVSGLRIPRQLRELRYCGRELIEAPNLNGLEELQVLDLQFCLNLTSLEGVGGLPALRCLNLGHCHKLVRLPNLIKSGNLEELDLSDCVSLELEEEDIQMLARLTLLQPVPFGRSRENGFRLDFARRKVLIHSSGWAPESWLAWKEDEWKERDLGTPPIQLGILMSSVAF